MRTSVISYLSLIHVTGKMKWMNKLLDLMVLNVAGKLTWNLKVQTQPDPAHLPGGLRLRSVIV